ncbi:MAG: tyrosine-protein phosphatase [Ferruginibacter sp.]|nr:tyrosine-protein phosphatase [Ferruginibacter sp.]
MKEDVEKFIPLIKTGLVSDADIHQLISRISHSIKEDSTRGKELGQLLGKIKQAAKEKDIHPAIHWVPVGNGFLAIGHKPGGKISFGGLKDEGTTAVLTLLNENEGAAQIGKQVTNQGMEWIWVPFSASRPHEGEAIAEVFAVYAQLQRLVTAGSKIYIHCSAGIHRTGMITYGFLRFVGKEKAAAVELLQTLRPVTAAQVGEERLVWANQFYQASDNIT